MTGGREILVKMYFLRAIALVASLGLASAQEPKPSTGQNLTDGVLGVTVLKEQPWTPPTAKQRWAVYKLRSFTGPGMYMRTVMTSLSDQDANSPVAWGQGWKAFGKRMGNNYATFQLIDGAEMGLSALAGYDPRYIQSRETGAWHRVGHAVAYNFVTLDGKGKTVLNWPKLVAAYGVGMLASTYTPGMKWSAEGLRMGTAQVSFGMVSDLVKEFVPDLLKKMRRKKAPEPPPATPAPVQAAKPDANF